ncbi:TrfB-related DNA-binding protein [Massilia sp. CCM 9210]|uniref:TrfB-related DNA-binding protein n=1 Tax=Massilia scottii TaxID=3057166 RepID=UPI002796C2BF|nr:TrfB-related DNA-binding protein [Massilia sp. CCM 9210]MDQ1817808.1 TrfB-related DNA-binding protein [Massilia sp. CCM 9210]
MPKVKRRMSSPEFDALRPWLTGRISEDRINAARAVLVDNAKHREVAAIHGWTRQAVNDAISAVWRAHERDLESKKTTANAGALLPPGWELVSLIAPSWMIPLFREAIARGDFPSTDAARQKDSTPTKSRLAHPTANPDTPTAATKTRKSKTAIPSS